MHSYRSDAQAAQNLVSCYLKGVVFNHIVAELVDYLLGPVPHSRDDERHRLEVLLFDRVEHPLLDPLCRRD